MTSSPKSYNGGFAGWGSSYVVTVARVDGRGNSARLESGDDRVQPPAPGGGSSGHAEAPTKHASLGLLTSVSIAGNDLLSSCLYTGGICAGYAGKLAPLSLGLVAVMLYFFRYVYGEVVTAMPMNGGSYTALNNTTSKRVAAMAACLSMVSYVATAVVSAEAAVQYLQLLVASLNTQGGTLLGTTTVLGIFAALTLCGISESATVASAMFVLHVATLTVLSIWAAVWAAGDRGAVFVANLSAPYPDTVGGSVGLAVYYGYAAALLGITGFETAANYVEEMRDTKTYVATLKWMWLSSSLFNPLLGALAMAVMPLSCTQVKGYPTSGDDATQAAFCAQPGVDYIYKYQANLLGPVAGVVGGGWFKAAVCIDGVIVLAGAVLTAYVGVGGLVKRLALDRCLPGFLLATNAARGTHHWIILGFFAITTSLLFILEGDVNMLSSVFNLAFLSVMTAFAAACAILKWKRPYLSRLVVASPGAVAAAAVLVVAGLVGNILRAPATLAYFFIYFGVAAGVVFTMFNATGILLMARKVVRVVLPTPEEAAARKLAKKHILETHARKEEAVALLAAAEERERRRGVERERRRKAAKLAAAAAAATAAAAAAAGGGGEDEGGAPLNTSAGINDTSGAQGDDGEGGSDDEENLEESRREEEEEEEGMEGGDYGGGYSEVSGGGGINGDENGFSSSSGGKVPLLGASFLSSSPSPGKRRGAAALAPAPPVIEADFVERGVNFGNGGEFFSRGSSSSNSDNAHEKGTFSAGSSGTGEGSMAMGGRRALVGSMDGEEELLALVGEAKWRSNSHSSSSSSFGGGGRSSSSSGGGGGDGGGGGGSSSGGGLPFSSSSSSSSSSTTLSGRLRSFLLRAITASLVDINSPPMVYFAKDCELDTLNKAISYVRANEQTSRLVIVHCANDLAARRSVEERDPVAWAAAKSGGGSGGGSGTSSAAAASALCALLESGLPPLTQAQRQLQANVALLDAVYPKLRLDSLILRGTAFSLPAVQWVGRHLGIGTNFMFMAMPGSFFPHKFAALGGLRVITRTAPRLTRSAREEHARRVTLASARALAEVPKGLVKVGKGGEGEEEKGE